MKNSEIINDPDYYRLPCGKYLEEFIAYKGLDFMTGSAVKYMWRAGKKYGESDNKDMNKCGHYEKFKAKWLGVFSQEDIHQEIVELVEEARNWDGEYKPLPIYGDRNTASIRDAIESVLGCLEYHEKDGSRIEPNIVSRLAMVCRDALAERCRPCDEVDTALGYWGKFCTEFKGKHGRVPESSEAFEAIEFLVGEVKEDGEKG